MNRLCKAKWGGKTYVILFFLMFGLIFSRYCYYGFTYWQQLDDYIQYHNYTAYNSDISELIDRLGLLSSRPLAGLADIYLWSHFYGRMIAAVAVISAMYAASAVFFHRVFSRQFGTGALFFVVYALLPLGIEGTYWVSASSRIVAGLFFASLSLLFFDRWCYKGRALNLLLFAIFQLAAFCFYEQIVLLSGAATLVVMLTGFGRDKKRPLWGFLMFAGAAIYFAITKLAEPGVYGARTQLFLPWQENWWQECFLPAVKQVGYVFSVGMFATLGRGLKRGFLILVSEPNIICITVFAALCAAMFFLLKGIKSAKARFWTEFLAGLFLAAAPLLLFFVLKSPWFGVRNAVPSFLGLALMLDSVFSLIFGRLRSAAAVQAAVVSSLCLLCCIAAVSEIHDYRETTTADQQIAKTAAEAIVSDGWTEGGKIWLLNVEATYAENANFFYHEHVYGVTSSDWALTGAIYAYAGRGDLPTVSPLPRHSPVAGGGFDPGTAQCYFYLDGELVRVALEAGSGGEWLITGSSNKNYGVIAISDGSVQLIT